MSRIVFPMNPQEDLKNDPLAQKIFGGCLVLFVLMFVLLTLVAIIGGCGVN